MLIAKRACQHDARRANASWDSSINEGPGRGVGRLHSMSRVATGWIPSPVGSRPTRDHDEAGVWREADELSESQVEGAESFPH